MQRQRIKHAAGDHRFESVTLHKLFTSDASVTVLMALSTQIGVM